MNGDEENLMLVKLGLFLLGVLFDKSIFLFFVCGGGGICVMCECYIDEGGGDVLFIEFNYFICWEVVENKCFVC